MLCPHRACQREEQEMERRAIPMTRAKLMFSRKPPAPRVSRRVREEDLTLYQAIVGKPPVLDELPPESPAPQPLRLATQPQRTWSPVVLSIRLRVICNQHIADHVTRPELADWLRHVTGEAFRRLDQAQARLAAARPAPAARRKVESRPIEPTMHLTPRQYNRVA
jgi:hypothetical protein